jgi:hypothetical protein
MVMARPGMHRFSRPGPSWARGGVRHGLASDSQASHRAGGASSRPTRRTKEFAALSPLATLSPTQLADDLAVRDLTDPTQGGHAIQLLVEAD